MVETGEAHEVHQFATLAGYGAEAINPYLAFETIEAMLPEIDEELTDEEAMKRYIKATDKGILKVMSKMGISTYQSYCGAQIFDAVGLQDRLRRQIFHRHQDARSRASGSRRSRAKPWSAIGWPSPTRRPARCARRRRRICLPHARRGAYVAPERRRRSATCGARRAAGEIPFYAKLINEQTEQLLTLRGMFRIKTAEMSRKPVPLEEVEPAKEIVKRFCTGAMSFGSITRSARRRSPSR